MVGRWIVLSALLKFGMGLNCKFMHFSSILRAGKILFPVFAVILSGCGDSEKQRQQNEVQVEEPGEEPAGVEEKKIVIDLEELKDHKPLLAEREALDETVWADEVEAQVYEMAFIKLWDDERAAVGSSKMDVLANFPFTGTFTMGKALPVEKLEEGISVTKFEDVEGQKFTPEEWKGVLAALTATGVEIIQTEWHHSRFVPSTETDAPRSTISFAIHAKQEEKKFALKGDLEVTWVKELPEDGVPVADSMVVTGLSLQDRPGGGLFEEFYTMEHGPNDFISGFPVLVYDLDDDGRSDIIIPRWNRVYWNLEGRRFRSTEFLDLPLEIWEAGILSDFDGDGHADFVTVGKDGSPYFCKGNAEGKFLEEHVVCADVKFNLPTAVTAGDIDADGDLDLWMTQYKLSFTDGQMPTPFYDANDGFPSYLLLNDGKGSFTNVTEAHGLPPRLGGERLEVLAIVAVVHADRLRLRLRFERLLEGHARLRLEHLLGHPGGELRPVPEPLGERAGLLGELRLLDHAVVEAAALGFRGVDEVTEHQQLGGAPHPDHPRQQVRGAHVGARQPTLVNRNAIRASGQATRKSDASAMTLPAPATTPFSDATIGVWHSRIDRMRSQVSRVNSSSPSVSRPNSGPMMSLTSPPVQKAGSSPVITTARTARRASSARKVSRSSS